MNTFFVDDGDPVKELLDGLDMPVAVKANSVKADLPSLICYPPSDRVPIDMSTPIPLEERNPEIYQLVLDFIAENADRKKNGVPVCRLDWDKGVIFVDPFQSGLNCLGRNELCPCGSQKKWKKCCLNVKFTDNAI